MVSATSYRSPQRTRVMACSKRRSRRSPAGWLGLAALVALFVIPQGAAAASANHAGAPVKHADQALGAAHVAWWRWAFSFPASTHPLNPAFGATCATGQTGKRWFLGGVVNSGGTVTRDCRIPSATKLVVAVANVECSTLEPPPFNGTTDRSLKACAAGVVNPQSPLFITGQFATLDGRSLSVPSAPSPAFKFTVPSASDTILGCAPQCSATRGRAVADGYLLDLHPLSVGHHTLHFGGRFPAFDFTLDITYNIDVVPRDHSR